MDEALTDLNVYKNNGGTIKISTVHYILYGILLKLHGFIPFKGICNYEV